MARLLDRTIMRSTSQRRGTRWPTRLKTELSESTPASSAYGDPSTIDLKTVSSSRSSSRRMRPASMRPEVLDHHRDLHGARGVEDRVRVHEDGGAPANLRKDHAYGRSRDLVDAGRDPLSQVGCVVLARDGLCSDQHRKEDSGHHECHLRP